MTIHPLIFFEVSETSCFTVFSEVRPLNVGGGVSETLVLQCFLRVRPLNLGGGVRHPERFRGYGLTGVG